MSSPTHPQTNKNAGIQILRGLAAAAVIVHHTLGESKAAVASIAPNWVMILGACGVDLFFVISGFIIYSVTFRSHDREPERASSFLLKRLIRIFPIYWVCVAVMIALWATGLCYRSLHPTTAKFICSIFLLPNQHQILYVAWTLVYEVYFYYVFTLALLLRTPLLAIIFTIGFIGAGLLASYLLPKGEIQEFLARPLVLEFCYGLILAHVLRHQKLNGWAWNYLWVPGLILMVVGAIYAPHVTTGGLSDSLRFLAWGLPALLIVTAFIQIPFNSSRTTRLFVFMGDASYSIYLSHPLVMIAYAFLITHGFFHCGTYQLILIPVVGSLCLLLGSLVYHYVEKPLLEQLRHRLGLTPRLLPVATLSN